MNKILQKLGLWLLKGNNVYKVESSDNEIFVISDNPLPPSCLIIIEKLVGNEIYLFDVDSVPRIVDKKLAEKVVSKINNESKVGIEITEWTLPTEDQK